MSEKIPYYIAKAGRAYWAPTRSMQRFGFAHTLLGEDGPNARALARALNEEWRNVLAAGSYLPVSTGRSDAKHYVYFVCVGSRIKIGFSKRPLTRTAEIAQQAAEKFGSVVIVRGSRSDERRLLDRFRAYQSRGEWFVASRPIRLTMTRSAAAGEVVHDGIEESEKSAETAKKESENGAQNVV